MRKIPTIVFYLLLIMLAGQYIVPIWAISAVVIFLGFVFREWYIERKRKKNLPPEYRKAALSEWDYYNLCYKKPKKKPNERERYSMFKDPPYGTSPYAKNNGVWYWDNWHEFHEQLDKKYNP